MESRKVLKELLVSGKLTKEEIKAVKDAVEVLTWPQDAAVKELIEDSLCGNCPDEIDRNALHEDVRKELSDSWINYKLIEDTVKKNLREFYEGLGERDEEWKERRVG